MIRRADSEAFPSLPYPHETILNAATQIYIEQMRIKAQNANRQQLLISRIKSALQRYMADMVDNSFSNEEAEAITDAATFINKFLDDWSVDNE
jgi:hypothetical protein